MFKKLTVREAEQVARHIAKDKIRKKIELSPEMERIETELAESLGTRVQIETRQVGGGKVVIDFFSPQDLQVILERLQKEVMNKRMQVPSYISEDTSRSEQMSEISKATPIETVATVTQDQAAPQDIKHTEDINVVLTDANSGKGDDVVPQKHVVEKPATEISAANSLALALGIPLSLIDVVPEKTETMIDVPYDDRPKGEQEEAMEQNDDDGLYAVSSFGI
jgi:hypothetical protein